MQQRVLADKLKEFLDKLNTGGLQVFISIISNERWEELKKILEVKKRTEPLIGGDTTGKYIKQNPYEENSSDITKNDEKVNVREKNSYGTSSGGIVPPNPRR